MFNIKQYLENRINHLEEQIQYKSDTNNIWFMEGCLSECREILAQLNTNEQSKC